MATRDELLRDLNAWRSLDTFTAQEDVEYAKQRMRELRAAIDELDKQNEPGHVCAYCKRTDEGNESFLGFHQARRANLEVCNDCAWYNGCACCDMPGNYLYLDGIPVIRKPVTLS